MPSRINAPWQRDSGGPLLRMGVFGVGVGPASVGCAAYLFFWGGAGRDGQRHHLGFFGSEGDAMARAPDLAFALLRGASPCDCDYIRPCREHWNETRRKMGFDQAPYVTREEMAALRTNAERA